MRKRAFKQCDGLKLEKMKMGKVLGGGVPGFPLPDTCPDSCSDWCAKDCAAGVNLNFGTSMNWMGGFWFG